MQLSAEVLNYLHTFLFVGLPYVSMAIFFVVSIQRYRAESFTYSSLSSQFLENRKHFWSLVPFHYGLLTVLTGHAVAFLIPRAVLAWNGKPLRLYVLEVCALICGLLTVVGLMTAMVRRHRERLVRRVTTRADWILFWILLFQVSSGVYVAIFAGWGSSWFASAVTPYLWSLVMFSPDTTYIIGMPLAVKLHIISAFVLIAYFPFTRLVHVLVVPNMYLWRKPQVVRWYGFRGPKETS